MSLSIIFIAQGATVFLRERVSLKFCQLERKVQFTEIRVTNHSEIQRQLWQYAPGWPLVVIRVILLMVRLERPLSCSSLHPGLDFQHHYCRWLTFWKGITIAKAPKRSAFVRYQELESGFRVGNMEEFLERWNSSLSCYNGGSSHGMTEHKELNFIKSLRGWKWGQSDSMVGKALALHVFNPSTIPSARILLPELTRSNPWGQNQE